MGVTGGTKDFLNVLMLYRDYGADEIESAVSLALEQGISNSGGVRHILIYANTPERIIPRVIGWESSKAPNLSDYDQLGGIH